MKPEHRQAVERLLAQGVVRRASDLPPAPVEHQIAPDGKPLIAKRKPRRQIEHIDEDGVIHHVDPNAPKDPAQQSPDEWLAGYDGGLSTDSFSQEPTPDADRSAAWNRKAKTVKPGSFAARRMASED